MDAQTIRIVRTLRNVGVAHQLAIAEQTQFRGTLSKRTCGASPRRYDVVTARRIAPGGFVAAGSNHRR